jgi:hypothetical protein
MLVAKLLFLIVSWILRNLMQRLQLGRTVSYKKKDVRHICVYINLRKLTNLICEVIRLQFIYLFHYRDFLLFIIIVVVVASSSSSSFKD